MKKLILILAAVIACTTAWSQPQPDYIPDQLGRDAHHIIQSLGAFVGNERAESQQFDITYMPSGNDVGGVMIINTADYRCTFQFDASTDICTELTIDIRSQVFLDQFYNLFAVYRTENFDNYRIMSFGNVKLRIVENPSTSTRYRSFKFTIE
jgi:hypothetical protein